MFTKNENYIRYECKLTGNTARKQITKHEKNECKNKLTGNADRK